MLNALAAGAETDSTPVPFGSPEPSTSPSASPAPSASPSPSPTPRPTATPIPWSRPIEGVLMNPFGNSYPFYGMLRSGHTGVDLAAPVGTPVYAVADGVIAKVVTYHNMRYGNYLVLKHDVAPYHTLYAHLQRILPPAGAHVRAGTRIGLSGVSGLASYPHLHFEVIDRVPVYDGAWGYRYICNRGTASGLPWLREHIGFVATNKIEMHSFLRMSKGKCQELPILPLTYFNPEYLLPTYPKGTMPDFSGQTH